MNTVVVGGACAGAAALAYKVLSRESITASAFRKASKYKIAHLSAGATAYRDLGKKGDTVLVIIHGGTLGSLAYVPYEAPFLAQHFRVITYDQYGRGFSDRPEAPLTLEVLRQQLEELLDHLNIHTAVLYGVSLGAAVAARFAAVAPARVAALGFQVPVIRMHHPPALRVLMAAPPLVRAWFARVLMIPMLIRRGESVAPPGTDARAVAVRRVIAHFKEQFTVIGTERCISSLFTTDALRDRMADHRTVAAARIACHYAYATDDPEMPRAAIEEAIALHAEGCVESAQYTGGHFFSEGRQTELAAEFAAFVARAQSAPVPRRRSKSPARSRGS